MKSKTRVVSIFDEKHGLSMTSGMQYLVTAQKVQTVLVLPVHVLIPLKTISASMVRSEDSIFVEYGWDSDHPIPYQEVFFDLNPLWPEDLLIVLRQLSNSFLFELTRNASERPV